MYGLSRSALLKANSTRATWIGSFLVVVILTFLTGCQLLGNNQNQVNNSVVLGSSSLDFGKVAVGMSKSMPNTLTNFKTSDVTIVSVAGLDADFQIDGLTLPLTLTPGQAAQFTVRFQPAKVGTPSKTVQFGDNAEFLASMTVSGDAVAAGQLALNPSAVNFGNVKIGSSQTNTVTVSNGGATDLTINSATLSGASFSMGTLSLPLTLAPGASTSFTVTFAPTGVGNFSGSVSFSSTAAAQAQAQRKIARGNAKVAADDVTVLSLTGAGVNAPGTLSANPASIPFGNVQIGTTSSKSETLTNTGAGPVTISQANVTGTGMSVTGLTLPTTLAQNQSVTFSVKFAPAAAGAVSGNVAIISNGTNSPLNIGLTGTGVTQGQLAPNPASLSFGNVVTGNSKSLTETLTNSGGSSVTISAATVTGTGVSISGLTLPLTLNAGQSTSFTVKFAPAAAGAVSGNVTITSNGSNPSLAIPVSGTGVTPGTLSANPASLSFGSVQVGNSSTLSETLTNTGGSNVTISQANVTGTGYSVSGLTLPATLTPNQSVTFNVKFAPAAAGTVSGNVAIVSDASNSPLNIALSGDGLAPGSLTASPSSVSFGNVVIGNSKTVPVTVTNTGGTSVTISAAATTGNSFSFTGPSLPVTLNGGQSATFNAIFTPPSAGNKNGSLTITSNANNPTLTIPLQGTGVTQGQLTPNPASLSFGNVVVGGNQSLSETLTNSGGTSVTISAASVTGTGMSLNGLGLPLTLSAGQSTSFNVKFAPAVAGVVSGNVTITSDGANPTLNIPVSGTGVTPGALSANPASLAFGNVQVGSNSSLSETLTNTGGVNVTISQANVTGSGFSVTGLTLPATLTPSQTLTFSVKFAPSAAGAVNGNVAIVSDAANSQLNIGLTGTGVAQGQLTPNPANLSFGNVQVGNSKNLTETLTNSGGSSLTISAATVTGSGMSLSGLTLPLTLNAGQTTSFTVQFAPAAGGAVSGNVTITSNGSNPTLNIPVSGTGVTPGTLTANPTTLAFGNVQVGNTGSLSETLTNSGGTTVTISQASVTGTGFSISGLTLPATLTSGQSVTFTATFAPTTTGSASGNLAVVSDAVNSPLNIAMTGNGTPQGQLSVSPATLDFGNVVVGANSALTGTLSASGASVTVTSGSSSSSEFTLSGITFPKTIAAGGSATFTVTFTPNATGTASATLTFLSNASNAPTAEALTGNGQAPPSHSVDLGWNASATPGVVGYNIYRRNPSGSYTSPLNSSLDANLNFTDNTVVAGKTYFYVVRAVDGNNVESGNSNEVQAVIPSP
jgi:glyoxylate utilization-related uncharacterized protein